MSSNPESSTGLTTGLTTVFKNLKTSPDSSVATEIDSNETDFNSTENENINSLYHQISTLQNEIKTLKQNLTNIEKTYADVPLPSTVIADRTGNSLYTLCPFYTHPQNTQLYNKKGTKISLTHMQSNFINSLYVLCPLTSEHPKNAPRFNTDGESIIGTQLFTNSNTRKRKRKSPSPGHKSPSPGHKSPSPGHKSPSPGHKSQRRKT
jgi:hypothetical protein